MVKKLPLLATCNNFSEEGKGIELGAPCVHLGCPLGVERLSQNGSANAQGPVQRNETLNTDESTQEGQYTEKTEPEKINWKGSQTQLAYLVQILLENGFIEHGDHWKMCAEHFLWQGKPIDNKKLAAAIGNVASFNKDGKPKKAEILESIVSDISNLEK